MRFFGTTSRALNSKVTSSSINSSRFFHTLPKATASCTDINASSTKTTTTTTTTRGLVSTTKYTCKGATAGKTLASLASDNPHVEVIRYEHKNVKWTLRHVEYFSDALAVGLLENGLIPGDVMLSWLPSHFAEQHILQFACSKAGFVLYNLDPGLAITDPAAAKLALKQALEISEANCLFSQEAGDGVNYIKIVKDVIPDIRIFDFSEGVPFFSPRFPHLRFPIHTGFDQIDKEGMLGLKHMLVSSGELDNFLKDSSATLDGTTPLLGQFVLNKDGIPEKKGDVLTNDDVVKGDVFPELSSILAKKHVEVEGVGVIF